MIIGAIGLGAGGSGPEPPVYSTYTQAVLASNPIAYWPMNDNGNTLVELIGGLNGSLSGSGTWVQTCLSPETSEVSFDFGPTGLGTVNDTGILQDIFSKSGRYTVEFILNLQGVDPGNSLRIMSKEPASNAGGWGIMTNSSTNTLDLIRNRGSGNDQFTSQSLTSGFGCTHCVVSYLDGDEANEAAVWGINGVIDPSPSNTLNGSGAYPGDIGANFLFGNRIDNDRQFLNVVSHIAIYDRDLMDFQVPSNPGGTPDGDNTEILSHFTASGIVP